MAWFTQAALDFFAELKANNNKPWFDAHKDVYEREVKLPMRRFAAELAQARAAEDPNFEPLQPDAYLFRIYRDTRFAKGEPYKTNAGAHLAPGGKNGGAGLYVHIEPGASFLGGGLHYGLAGLLKVVREEILYNMDEFERIVNDPALLAAFPEGVNGEKQKRLTNIPADASTRQPLLFNKQLVITSPLSDAQVLSDDLLETCLSAWRAGGDFLSFINRALQHAERP